MALKPDFKKAKILEHQKRPDLLQNKEHYWAKLKRWVMIIMVKQKMGPLWKGPK